MAEALRDGRPRPASTRPRPGDAWRRIGSLRRAARRAGPRTDRPRPSRSPLGSDIWPHGRWRMDFPGEANHAGTTRLEDRRRRDARLRRTSSSPPGRRPTQHGCVATIGKVARRARRRQRHPSPSPPGSTPGAPTRPPFAAAVADARRRPPRRAARPSPRSPGPPPPGSTPSWPRASRARLGGTPVLGTGAGHDAGILANAGIPDRDALRPQPHRRLPLARPSAPSATTASPGSRALTAVLAELAGATPMTTLLGRARLAADRCGHRCAVHRRRTVASAGSSPRARRSHGDARLPGVVLPGLRQHPQPRLPPGPAGADPRRRRQLLDVAASRCMP